MTKLPPHEVDRLLMNLTFLSYVEDGHKVSFSRYQIHDSNSFIESLKRFLNGESRMTTITTIKNVLSNADDIFRKYPDYRSQIRERLGDAKKGIRNLMYTYSDDPYLKSELYVILGTIDSLIEQIRQEDSKR